VGVYLSSGADGLSSAALIFSPVTWRVLTIQVCTPNFGKITA
jgi:hypothetical protein